MTIEEFEEIFDLETMIKIRDWVNEHYVRKDKIKDKIKDLEKQEKIYEELDDTVIYWEIIGKIQLLKELVEEGDTDAK